jgi:molybdopterin synthase catalytic subunit
MHVSVRVQQADFDVGAEWQALRHRIDGRVGAVATFVGLVRDRAPEGEVSTLVLEHYPGMTERSMEKIVEQAAERWPLDDVTVVHRFGTLTGLEQIVFVQVAAGHRDAAFAAAEFIMDYLKTDAVFWKREEGAAGSRWIEATASDTARRGGWE